MTIFGYRPTLSSNAAGRWFLQSGIQEASGGVARYYRSDQRQNAPVSTEITGYTLSALLFLHQRTGDAAYLEAGLRAARFLTRTAWDTRLGHISVRAPGEWRRQRLAYFFDCGIIVRGLLSAWRVTEDSEFLDAADRRPDTAMLADFPGRERHPSDSGAARQAASALGSRVGPTRPGCYQLKSAMAWRELFEVTGEARFSAVTNRRWRPRSKTIVSFCPATPDRHRVMDRLHAYSYFLEGLLPVLDRPECAAAFRNGVDRAASIFA